MGEQKQIEHNFHPNQSISHWTLFGVLISQLKPKKSNV